MVNTVQVAVHRCSSSDGRSFSRKIACNLSGVFALSRTYRNIDCRKASFVRTYITTGAGSPPTMPGTSPLRRLLQLLRRQRSQDLPGHISLRAMIGAPAAGNSNVVPIVTQGIVENRTSFLYDCLLNTPPRNLRLLSQAPSVDYSCSKRFITQMHILATLIVASIS